MTEITQQSAEKCRPKPPGGSRKGKPNKVTKELKDMILGALDDAGGQVYLAQQALENPGAFMALVGKVLPKNIEANVNMHLLESMLSQVRGRD
jgi:hypothetical protein